MFVVYCHEAFVREGYIMPYRDRRTRKQRWADWVVGILGLVVFVAMIRIAGSYFATPTGASYTDERHDPSYYHPSQFENR